MILESRVFLSYNQMYGRRTVPLTRASTGFDGDAEII